MTQEFTIGVEEEYQIIDPKTYQLCGHAAQIIPLAQPMLRQSFVQTEVYGSQIEVATPVCPTLAEVRAALVQARSSMMAAAAIDGNTIASAGTHPFSNWHEQQITPKARYQWLAREYQQILRELVIFGYHVHVGVSEREMAVGVLNRARAWFSPLLALSANSPFWLGEDTGYASYRTEIWSRFPLTGLPLPFSNYAEYQALERALINTGVIKNASKIYWDARLSSHFPTVEFRVADACLTINEAVMLAGLSRALVRTCYEQIKQEEPLVEVRPELLRSAHWHAARYGLEADLIDVFTQRLVPARELVEKLLFFLRPALVYDDEWDEVSSLVNQTLERGTGAQRQRLVYRDTGNLIDVVDFIIAQTRVGTDNNPI